ncbi:MAG: hypothetical protein IJ654_06510 [Bacteroidales bacterium]|nr:hypothetical protein [Bacteroidales bacterium]
MKKWISIAACLLAAVSVLVSCEPKQTPDGKCELLSFALTSSLNSALPADITGTIDASAKTVTLVIPTAVTSTAFIPSFTVSDYDVVTIGGKTVTSGETSVTLTDGTQIQLSDEVSALNATYTVVVKANDETAELTAVSFKAADNDLLDEDVVPEAIAPEMIVRVPGTAFQKELKITVEAGFNDVIKVNNTPVESGASLNVDTTFPIDIVVTDEVAGTSVTYVVKVGKILEYVIGKLGTYTEGTIADFTMTLNPTDNLPYFAYTRKVGEEKNNGVSVAKWNGSAFARVGPTGVADASARSASKPQVAFAKDGTLYAKYLGGEVASKPTVKKLDSEWVVVGTTGFTPQNNNTTYFYPFYVHPANGKLSLFWNGNTKSTDSYRTMNLSTWGGETWASSTISGVIPAYGSGTTATSGMYYTSSAVVNDSKVFIASSLNEFGYYVHEVNADGSLTTIVDNYLPDGAPQGLPGNLQMKQGPDGVLYVLAAVRAGDGTMQIFTVDQSNKTLKAYGTGLPVSISSSGGISQDFGFSVNPVDGLVVAAYDSAEGNTVFAYLDDNLQWSSFAVDSLQVGTSGFFVEFDKDGNGYIAYQSADGIELYRVGLEADVLPE